MDQYIESTDEGNVKPSKIRQRRRRSNLQSLSPPNKEALLKKYQSELKEILSQHPTKNKIVVKPTKSHIFLDWEAERINKPTDESQPKLKPIPERVERKHNDSKKKHDELIKQRYNTLNSIQRVRIMHDKSRRLSVAPTNKYTIDTDHIKLVKPRIGRKKLDSLKAKAPPVLAQTPQKDNTRQRFFTEASHTVTEYRPSRNQPSSQSKSHMSAVAPVTSKYFQGVKRRQIFGRGSINLQDSKMDSVSVDNMDIDLRKTAFQKKTVFYKKILQQKAATQKIESEIGRKPIRLLDVPTKQSLSSFISSYQPLQSTFNIEEVLKSPAFSIIRFRDAIYIGEVQVGQEGNKLRHGKGIYITKKWQFEGQFHQNQKVFGSEVTEEGVYKGEFQMGSRNGKGQFRWHNGEYYNGEWKNNKKHGSGIWTSAIGHDGIPDSYIGEWDSGNVQGYGVHTFNNGKNKYQGQFIKFLKDGRGVQRFENGDRYEGFYKKGKAEGYGEYFWADGSYYKGEFKNGLRQGKGLWLLSTKDCYEGELKEDCKHGRGKLIYSNGQIFQGTFEMDKREGPGVLLKDQQKIEGVWKNDQLCK